MASRWFCCLGEVSLITSVYSTISSPCLLHNLKSSIFGYQFGILKKISVLTKILTGNQHFSRPAVLRNIRNTTPVYYALNKLSCAFGTPAQKASAKTRMLEGYCVTGKGVVPSQINFRQQQKLAQQFISS